MFLLIMGQIDDNNTIVSTTRYLLSIFPIFFGQAESFKSAVQELVQRIRDKIIRMQTIKYQRLTNDVRENQSLSFTRDRRKRDCRETVQTSLNNMERNQTQFCKNRAEGDDLRSDATNT